MNRTLFMIIPVLMFPAAASVMARKEVGAPKVTITRWPQNRAAAILLTFDDGMDTHPTWPVRSLENTMRPGLAPGIAI